jgi:addiction module HigA family antidote
LIAQSRVPRVHAPRVNKIVRKRRSVSADTGSRLSRYFDTTPQFWWNLQTAYDLRGHPPKLPPFPSL